MFSRIGTPSGLAEWFADNVTEDGKIFTFNWGNIEQKAEIMAFIPNESISFRWLNMESDSEFGFNIIKDELTGDVALVISDHVYEDEVEDTKSLWSSQVAKLKQMIGS